MGPTPGPPPPWGMQKVLWEVEVAYVGAELAGIDESDLSVEVGSIEVDLAAIGVDDLADLADLFFVDAVGGRVGDHYGGENVGIFRSFFAKVVDVDVTELVAAYAHNFHGGHLGGGGIGAVSGGGDEADIAMTFAAAAMVGADGEQAGVLTLRAGVGLEGEGVVAGDVAEAPLEGGDHLRVAEGLVAGGEGMDVPELGPGDGKHLGGGI